ncbi:DUF4189 domain-containing protein [Xanthomonas translucens]
MNRLRHFSKISIFMAAALFFSYAEAQTACPTGVTPGSALCGPGPGAGYVEPPPPTPSGEWETKWGAVASDTTGTGNIGVAEKKETKEDALKEALAQCQSLGGGKCKVDMWYANQCAAIASPYKNGSPAKGNPASRSGKDVAAAQESATSVCMKYNASNVDSCVIIYSGCSQPVFHKY